MNLTQAVKHLHDERSKLQNELSRLDAAINALDGTSRKNAARPRRGISAAGRRRIAAAQRARWAKLKAKQRKG